MSESVELWELDLRYEGYRLRDDAYEARLLTSMAQRGIEQPLEGVDTSAGQLLLNGFKRYRCARKLKMYCVPYVSLGEEEASGIIQLLRGAKHQALSLLEQARFVTDLLTIHGLSVAEVAETLGRSKGWISMRRGLLDEMSPTIQELLFQGDFPVYAYLYTLRPFRRMNGVAPREIEQFMRAVAGQHLSVRDLELLAQAYFRGPASLREAIESGQWSWSLQQMKSVPEDREGCSAAEQGLLRELQILRKSLQRVLVQCADTRLQSRAFYAQANLLAGSLLEKSELFWERIRELYDRSGHA